MRSPVQPRAVLRILALIPALALTGCVTQPTIPASDVVPESSPAPSVSSSTVADPGPASRVAWTCEGIASSDQVRTLTGIDDASRSSYALADTLGASALQQIGALDCTWTSPSSPEPAPAGAGLTVQIVPGYPADFRDELSPLYDPQRPECSDRYCSTMVWTDDFAAFLEVGVVDGSTADLDAFADLKSRVAAHLQDLTTPSAIWSPAGSPPYAAAPDCADLIDPDTYIDLTGADSGEAEFRGPSVQRATLAAPRYMVGQVDCYWMDATVSYLPGGGWAFEDELDGAVAVDSNGVATSSIRVDGRPGVIAKRGDDLVQVVGSTDLDSTILERLATVALGGS